MHDPVSIAAIMEGKRRRRWDAIVALRREAAARGLGESLELGYWALIHDLEHASITTNLDQLAEIGVVPLDARSLDDGEVEAALRSLIDGLAVLEVYLQHTDHLDDRTLYSILHQRILRESVRDVPPGVGAREWIDLAAGTDSEIWYRFYASEADRTTAVRRGEVVPDPTPRVADRDRRLPRP